MQWSIIFLCSLSLVNAVNQRPEVYGLSISSNGKLVASTLQAKTIYKSVKDDNDLLEQVLKLSQNSQTAIGVRRFVEIASEHAADVVNVCVGLKSALEEAGSGSSVSSLKQACDSRETLSDALDYWRENEDFIRKNIPTAAEYLGASIRPAIEFCVSDLFAISACYRVS
jgi:hypothetical protein